MPINDDDLQEVGVSARDRSPGILERARQAPGHFAQGTLLPRLMGIISPDLYRERGDTSSLIDRVFSEGGELESLAIENPALAQEIRQQSQNPMSSREHEAFRSGILNLVGDKIKQEEVVQRTIGEGQSYMRAFAKLDGMIPRSPDPKYATVEEKEREQIVSIFNDAQRLAPTDPEGAKNLMAEARRRGDALTANLRGDMEKVRKSARIEDVTLFNAAREQTEETKDVIAALRHDMDEKGVLQSANPALLQRAFNLLGRAGDLPSSGFSDAATVVGAGASDILGGSKAGNAVDAVLNLAGKAADKFKEGDNINSLIDRLEFNAAQVQQGYENNRAKLSERYAPLGFQFGKEAGEVYAVLKDQYEEHASAIPEKGSAPGERASDNTKTLRLVLADENDGAAKEVERLKPEAAANMPGARQKLAAAVERHAIARDDLAIFDAETSGTPEEQLAPSAVQELTAARQRRAAREQTRAHSQTRQTIVESLRNRIR